MRLFLEEQKRLMHMSTMFWSLNQRNVVLPPKRNTPRAWVGYSTRGRQGWAGGGGLLYDVDVNNCIKLKIGQKIHLQVTFPRTTQLCDFHDVSYGLKNGAGI